MSRGRRTRRHPHATRAAQPPRVGELDPVATQPLPQPAAVDEALPAELATKLREISPCTHCGGRHPRACPRVKRMSFHPSGALASVEFWRDGQWSDDGVIWPEQLEE